jgi:hypothetical protein
MGFFQTLSSLRLGKRTADVNARLAQDLAREFARGNGSVEFALLQVLDKITQEYFEELKLTEDEDPLGVRRRSAAEILSAMVEEGVHFPVSLETYDLLLGEMSRRGITVK